MQAAGVIAGLLLVGLMAFSGFQLVPPSVATGTTSSFDTTGPAIEVSNQATPQTTVSASTIEPQTPLVPTSIDTLRPQNVEQKTATLRGDVVVGSTDLGTVFFVYSYDQSALARAISRARSYDDVLESKSALVGVKSISRSVKRSGEVSVRVGSLAPNTQYYVQLCAEFGATIRCAAATDFQTVISAKRPGDVRLPTLRTERPVFLDADTVQLTARVDMHDTIDGRVYLIYGQSERQVTQAVDREYRDIRTDDEDLQKTRLLTNARGAVAVTKTLDRLDDETNYFYAVCASYDGLRDGFVCGRVQSFVTHSDEYGQTPTVRTFVPTALRTDVVLAGEVQMRPFRNGQVFMVFGTDSNRISKLGGETSMSGIRQSGDRIQRIVVDTDLDRTDTYVLRVKDLAPAATYATRICVEYKNQNKNYRDALFVECGEVQLFTTD